MATYMWKGGIRETAFRLALSSAECRAAAHALERADLALLKKIKHMAERHIEVPSTDNHLLWLFYLPDFTRLFVDWYVRYIDHVFAVYAPTADAGLTFDGTNLLFTWRGCRPRERLVHLLDVGEYGTVRTVLEAARQARVDAERALVRFDDRLRGRSSTVTVAELVRVVSRFAAYALNNVFPEELFVERFPHVPLYGAYFTPISSWQLLFERALDALEAIYVGEATREVAVERYARETAYVRWGDIESCDDDLAFAARLFDGIGREFPTCRSIWEHHSARRDRRRISGDPRLGHEREVHTWRALVAPADRELFDTLITFAAEGQEYNEHRRLIFTRTLRLLRELCERNGHDWRTVSLETLEEADQKAAIAAA
ncbi:hypothetical protein HY478_02585 [Candidatus Uhrbacteria bacterium]|nr:hypothetical protein [Candidatus Uhrbacteria bacterium]